MFLHLAFVLLTAVCVSAQTAARSLPNVVVIYTDDQGYGDCRALNPDCGFATPNLDRIAREGMTFTDAHSASGVCTPSRYALLTGRYAWRTRLKRGVMGADDDCLIEDGRWTVASILRDRGYATAMFGKWHLGMQIDGRKGQRDWSAPVTDGPLQKGFEQFFGIPASMNFGVLTWFDGDRATASASLWTRKKFPKSEIVTKPLQYRMAPPFDPRRKSTRDVEVAEGFRDEDVLRITTEKTIAFLESRDDSPFFVYVALTSPHLPHCTAPEFRGRSGMGNYGDFMLETDHRVGEILDALDKTKAAQNTIVLFSSDNGPENNYKDWIARYGHHANGGFRGGKRDLYEGGHRVPLFVRWPLVVEAGARSDALVGQVDLAATVAEIVGVKLPDEQAEDSVSFVHALRGGDRARGDQASADRRSAGQLAEGQRDQIQKRTTLVHHSGAGHFGYRRGDWKIVFLPPARGKLCELYNLATDSREQRDVASEHPDLVRELTAELTGVVARGRSRPGRALGNDGAAWWPQLTFVEPPLPEPRDEVYKTIGKVKLRLTIYEPAGRRQSSSRPAAVFFFGGGWHGGTTTQFEPHARYLARRGMVGIVADYRVKSRHGTTPFECVADGKSALRWVRANAGRLGIDPKRIAAGGGSAGGHVAATTGVVAGLEEPGEDSRVSSKADALLLFNPVFDNGPTGYGHARVRDRYKEISPLHNLASGAPPTVVFFGTKDKHVPVATAERYKARAEAVGSRCDLHLYESQPHGFFNKASSAEHFYLTVCAMDRFLASLGWLEGAPTLRKPAR